MKTIVIKTKYDILDSMKETPDERKERLRYDKCMRTKSVPSKKGYYNRQQYKRACYDY